MHGPLTGTVLPPRNAAAGVLHPSRIGDGHWRSIGWAYLAYVASFLLGSLLHDPILNVVGAAVMTGLLLMVWLRRLVTPRGRVLLPLMFTATTVVASSFGQENDVAPGAVVKLLAVLLLIFLGLAWRLRPLNETKTRWRIMVLVVTVLAVSIAMPMDEAGDARLAGRVAGVFVNPNNLALTALLLLFCLDEEKDRATFFWGVRLFVLGVILATGTSGALLGYVVETGLFMIRRGKRWPVVAALTAVTLGVALLTWGGDALPDIPIPQVQKLQRQLRVVASSQDALLQGAEIDFYSYEKDYGAGVTSGLWRLVHWSRLLADYARGSAWQILFGRGLESVRANHRLPAHNDYLRVLFELGAVGLLSWLATWIALYRRANTAAKRLFIMVAVYCFTENNMDNFLFMSFFALFAAGAATWGPSIARTNRVAATVREAGSLG